MSIQVPEGYREIEGSERHPSPDATVVGPADPSESLTLTIVLRRRPDGLPVPDFSYYAATPPSARPRLSEEEFAASYGAADEDIAKVVEFAASQGLTVTQVHRAGRTVKVSGTVGQASAAFGVELRIYQHSVRRRKYEQPRTETYRGRDGSIYLPGDVADVVVGVFGLDNRRITTSGTGDPPSTTMTTVPQVRDLYQFPANSAAGQTIAIFSEAGYQKSDIENYFATLPPGYPALTPRDIPVDASNDGTEDVETTQDICIAATAAPGAAIAVYFTTYTQDGWVDLLRRVIHPETGDPHCSVLSSSFYVSNGDNPADLDFPVTLSWLTAVDQQLEDAAIQGVTVCICSGDQGSDCDQGLGQAFVTFPASDPWVLGVGGTTIGNISGSSFDEYVWNDTFDIPGFLPSGATGGGVSYFAALPSYQAGAGVPASANKDGRVGRGVPDVAANASPNSGYPLSLADATSQGLQNPFPMSGTSASTPLWAGLVAVMNAAMGADLGFLNAILYQIAPAGFREITGPPGPASNTFNGAPGYPATAGWNACTGWGSPQGEALLSALTAAFQVPSLQFWVTKSTFGVDEVTDTKYWPNAFALVLEGFAPFQLPTFPAVSFSGAFTAVPGVTISPNSSGPQWQDASLSYTAQRLEFPFDITFTAGSLAAFPAAGSAPTEELLQASVTPLEQTLTADTVLELVGGADPYFTNIDPNAENPFWLSQDLRVFVATPGINPVPVASGPVFNTADPTALDPAAAYGYIQQLITYLNANFSDPTGTDPFAGAVPQQSGQLSGDASVTPTTQNPGGAPFQNYNLAIARVRLRGATQTNADAVRVFFRLFTTQSNDTDYQPTSTYLSSPDAAGLPGVPEIGTGNTTFPFFATGDPATQTDYVTGGANNQNLTITSGDSLWAYFGCFLDVYDPNYIPGGLQLAGTHHCLVAQIAYDQAPIVNSNGVTASPENSDKLAQRNLQVTPSDNPGPASAHRIPQTFDLRPSATAIIEPGRLTGGPDELMIDWGSTPVGSLASIYWPSVPAGDVIALADKLYTVHGLKTSDAHTIQTTVADGICYVPIPTGTGQNIAGLFTVDLPSTVRVGEEFSIVVRRVATRALDDSKPTGTASRANLIWRYVVGTFGVQIPVATSRTLLAPEENTLAILKWRLEQLPPTDRWHPVLVRYIEYVSGRVNGLGGHAGSIPASPTGYQPVPACPADRCAVGKVTGVVYDRFGDFDGFWLRTEEGEERRYHATEARIESVVRFAWAERVVIEVRAFASRPAEPTQITLLRAEHE
jgi:Pro-kumamolisin, activation domain